PIWTMRIDIALGEAVIRWIGIDQDSSGSPGLGIAYFQSSKQAAVSCENDLPLEVDAHFLEGIKIFGPAQVCVHDLSAGFARYAVAVKGTEGRAAGGILIGRDGRLVEGQGFPDWTFNRKPGRFRAAWASVAWVIEQHLEFSDVCLPSPFAKL